MAGATSSPSPLVPKIAALTVLGLSCVAAMTAFGTLEMGAQWLPAWASASALYTVAAVGLWRGAPWSRSLTLGVVTWGLVAWVQSSIALLGPLPLVLGVIGGHLVAVGLLLASPCGLERRHRISLVLAGAALPGALMFGLAPLQDPTTRVMLVGGAGLLFSMSVGLVRGRTWGLFAGLLAVPMLATGAFVAPPTVSITFMHPLLPEGSMPGGVLLLRLLGVTSAALALASVVPFVGPVVRFVSRQAR